MFWRRLKPSLLLSRSWRPLQRQWSSSFKESLEAEEAHAQGTMVTWRRISLFVAIPAVSYLTWKLLIVGDGHEEQREYVPWQHLRIRNKPFPWGDGDKSLFHNPHTNPAPPGDKGTEEQKKQSTLENIQEAWLSLHDDPEERDRQRWEHLAQMQKRKEEYLAKKAVAIDKAIPLQPMDLFTEIKHTPVNPVDSEMEN